MAVWRARSFRLAAAVCGLAGWTISSQRVPPLSAQAAAQTDTRPNVVVMLVGGNRRIMGAHVNGPWLTVLGWTATAVMTAAALAFFAVSL